MPLNTARVWWRRLFEFLHMVVPQRFPFYVPEALKHSHGHDSRATPCHTAEAAHNATHTGCYGAAKATHDAIAKRAYAIYLKTGSKPGPCQRNWHQAERDLQAAGRSSRAAA